MNSYKQVIEEKVIRFLISCKRYKKSFLCAGIIMIISIGWGALRGEVNEENHLPTLQLERETEDESYQHSKKNGESGEVEIVYDISSSLRAHPWKEVLTRDTNTLVDGAIKSVHSREEVVPHDSHILVDEPIQKKYSDENNNILKHQEQVNQPQKVQIRVAGIIQGPIPYAIIDMQQTSKTMKIGDSWNAIRLISIGEYGVYIEQGGELQWLDLQESF